MDARLAFARGWHEGAWLKPSLLAVSAASLTAGTLAWFADCPDPSAWLWGVGTAIILTSLVTEIGTSPGRGEFGLDLIAALAMSGALFLGEYFAGLIIAMMFAGGEALEDFAQRRARHGLTALLDRVPRTAAAQMDETFGKFIWTVTGFYQFNVGAIVTRPLDGRIGNRPRP